MSTKKEAVNHPSHYQTDDPTYEAIKVIRAYKMNFSLGNSVKYILRAGKKKRKVSRKNKQLYDLVQLKKTVEDLRKSKWYIDSYIEELIDDYKKKYNIKGKKKIL